MKFLPFNYFHSFTVLKYFVCEGEYETIFAAPVSHKFEAVFNDAKQQALNELNTISSKLTAAEKRNAGLETDRNSLKKENEGNEFKLI